MTDERCPARPTSLDESMHAGPTNNTGAERTSLGDRSPRVFFFFVLLTKRSKSAGADQRAGVWRRGRQMKSLIVTGCSVATKTNHNTSVKEGYIRGPWTRSSILIKIFIWFLFFHRDINAQEGHETGRKSPKPGQPKQPLSSSPSYESQHEL